jgi:hypothetical protein
VNTHTIDIEAMIFFKKRKQEKGKVYSPFSLAYRTKKEKGSENVKMIPCDLTPILIGFAFLS